MSFLIAWICFKIKLISFFKVSAGSPIPRMLARGARALGSGLAVTRYKPCLDTLHGSHVHSPQRISFRCAHTLWCDMNPPRRFSHMHARCFSAQRNRVECGAAPLLNINLPFFFPPFFFCVSYHFCCMCVTFGRMLAGLRISPGEAGRGRNLEGTSSQDPTRCWSCSPIEHEILSAGRWFIILLLLLGGGGGGGGGGGERERLCERGEMHI